MKQTKVEPVDMTEQVPVPEVTAPKFNKTLLIAIAAPVVVLLVIASFISGLLVSRLIANETEVEDEVIDGSDETDTEEVFLDVEFLPIAAQEKVELNPGLVATFSKPDSTFSVDESSAYLLGVVQGGTYDGYELVQNIFGSLGMGWAYDYYYVLENPNDRIDAVLLSRYMSYMGMWEFPVRESDTTNGDTFSTTITDGELAIPEFEMSSTITDVNEILFDYAGLLNRIDFEGVDANKAPKIGSSWSQLADGTVVYEMVEGTSTVYEDSFYTIRPDNRYAIYEVNVPFWTAGPEGDLNVPNTPNIIWEDGSRNTDEYLRGDQSRCGMSSITNVASDITDSDLIFAGTIESERVFTPKTLTADRYKSSIASYNSFSGEEEVTLEELQEIHPYFYWQDSLGRWIEFTNVNFLPAAECGKPVIYLYPEETTQVNVQLAPVGGFSYTEPAYGMGWNVVAEPNGELTNLSDGKTYPYLFWEGKGGLYQAPEKYWVIAKADVEGFLTSTLAQLGLNEKEIADFNEFWLPRMQNAPYYKIGFHGTSVMNALAPMQITPAPDSVLRILMDYQELDTAIPSNPPTLPKTFERTGFTVVEWGGVIQ
ncbi:MAG: hypothetical protein WCT24_01875 [Patescibacteria group bacterium]